MGHSTTTVTIRYVAGRFGGSLAPNLCTTRPVSDVAAGTTRAARFINLPEPFLPNAPRELTAQFPAGRWHADLRC